MSSGPHVIAIDGPAASGKSSTAQWVARRLGHYHVDSGSLYRAATAVQLERDTDPETWTEGEVLAGTRRVSFVPSEGAFVPLIDGEPADEKLRGSEVTRNVSRVAKMPAVRNWVNEQVRLAGRAQSVVVDGRDIGTVVFPDASLKVFLVADPWERARRRLIQRLDRHPSDQEIAEETDLIVQRDAKDSTQTVQATDAVLIDTTYLTQEDQVERIVALANAVTHRPGGTSVVDGDSDLT
ncbi:MAG: Cytidylate kinase [Gemmatimonadetes bacterium]|nr:Cytidylate kinase [Gemmatimonadota bacterium]